MGSSCSRGGAVSAPGKSNSALRKQAIEGRRRSSCGAVAANTTCPSVIASFAGVTLGFKKQQDRFLIVPELVPGILYCGVFDGHGDEGDVFAERAARYIGHSLAVSLKLHMDGPHNVSNSSLSEFKGRISEVFTKVYLDFQLELAKEYEMNVATPIEEMRIAMEKQEGFSIPRSLPMKGGTTATTAIVAEKYLAVAWAGDSRSVICCMDAEGVLSAYDLTTDHNCSSGEERERAESRGGVVVGKHIVVDEAEGMLQVLRSLGDVPHHKNDIVTAQPEVAVLEVNPEQHAFVILASDGVWGELSSQQVITSAYNRIRFCLSTPTRKEDVTASLLSAAVLTTCKSFEDEVVTRCSSAGRSFYLYLCVYLLCTRACVC